MPFEVVLALNQGPETQILILDGRIMILALDRHCVTWVIPQGQQGRGEYLSRNKRNPWEKR